MFVKRFSLCISNLCVFYLVRVFIFLLDWRDFVSKICCSHFWTKIFVAYEVSALYCPTSTEAYLGKHSVQRIEWATIQNTTVTCQAGILICMYMVWFSGWGQNVSTTIFLIMQRPKYSMAWFNINISLVVTD